MSKEQLTTFNPYRVFNGINIPEGIYNSSKLTPVTKIVYGRLLRYAGKNGVAYPKQETIATELNVSINTIKRAIKQLVDNDLIVIERGNRLNHEANRYYFIFNNGFFGSTKNDTSVSTNLDTKLSTKNDTSIHIEESQKEESHIEENKKNIKEKSSIYGEYKNVRLTDNEYKKLVERFNENETINWIDRLDEYVEMTGKKYKRHYATILNWSKREKQTQQVQQQPKTANHKYDEQYEELGW